MQDVEITLRLPLPLLQAAQKLAKTRDESLGRVMRMALAAEVKRAGRAAKTSNRTDEQLLGPLRTLLAVDFGRACDWRELQGRLKAKGYILREAGGGLALHGFPDGPRLCKASELGHSYGSLMKRFGQPLPGHSHRWIANKVLGEPGALTANGRGAFGTQPLEQERPAATHRSRPWKPSLGT